MESTSPYLEAPIQQPTTPMAGPSQQPQGNNASAPDPVYPHPHSPITSQEMGQQQGTNDKITSIFPGPDAILTGQEPCQGSATNSNFMADQIKSTLKEPFPEPGTPLGFYIHNEQDFVVKMAVYKSLSDKDRAANQPDDYPADVDVQRLLVRKLVEAMTNLDADDSDAKIPVGRIRKLSPFEFNLMGWAVLLEIRDVQRGVVGIPSWGKDFEHELCDSFAKRFELVRKVLWDSKTTVSSLFDHAFIKRLVLQPSTELQRKKTNKALNNKRKEEHQKVKRLQEQQQTGSSPTQSMSPASGHGGVGTVSTTPAEQRMKHAPRHEIKSMRRQETGRGIDGMGPASTQQYVQAPVVAGMGPTVTRPDMQGPVAAYHDVGFNKGYDRRSPFPQVQTAPSGSDKMSFNLQAAPTTHTAQDFSNVKDWLKDTPLANGTKSMDTVGTNGLQFNQGYLNNQVGTSATNSLTPDQHGQYSGDPDNGVFDAEFQPAGVGNFQQFPDPAQNQMATSVNPNTGSQAWTTALPNYAQNQMETFFNPNTGSQAQTIALPDRARTQNQMATSVTPNTGSQAWTTALPNYAQNQMETFFNPNTGSQAQTTAFTDRAQNQNQMATSANPNTSSQAQAAALPDQPHVDMVINRMSDEDFHKLMATTNATEDMLADDSKW